MHWYYDCIIGLRDKRKIVVGSWNTSSVEYGTRLDTHILNSNILINTILITMLLS